MDREYQYLAYCLPHPQSPLYQTTTEASQPPLDYTNEPALQPRQRPSPQSVL